MSYQTCDSPHAKASSHSDRKICGSCGLAVAPCPLMACTDIARRLAGYSDKQADIRVIETLLAWTLKCSLFLAPTPSRLSVERFCIADDGVNAGVRIASTGEKLDGRRSMAMEPPLGTNCTFTGEL
jgi:hypothetical protein